MKSTGGRCALRAGIIGSGFMARTHARAIRSAGGRVVAAVTSTADGAERAATATGADVGLETVDQLFSRTDIDVVHICTPNTTHEDFALQALAARMHVVCEKPLAITAESARRIARAASVAGRTGTVPYIYRFHPMVREMRARVRRGELGVASVAHGSYLQDWLAAANSTNWRVDAATGGASRAFADIGSHWFDLFEFVMGDPITSLSAQLATVLPRRAGGTPVETEDAATVQFRTARGVLGAVVIAQVAAGRKNRLHIEVSGTESSFAFDQEEPERLWVGRTDSSIDLRRDPALLTDDAARLSFLPSGHPQGYQDAFDAFVADSYALMDDTLASGAAWESVPTLDAGHRAAVLCDAVLASSTNGGAWVSTAAPTISKAYDGPHVPE